MVPIWEPWASALLPETARPLCGWWSMLRGSCRRTRLVLLGYLGSGRRRLGVEWQCSHDCPVACMRKRNCDLRDTICLSGPGPRPKDTGGGSWSKIRLLFRSCEADKQQHANALCSETRGFSGISQVQDLEQGQADALFTNSVVCDSDESGIKSSWFA